MHTLILLHQYMQQQQTTQSVNWSDIVDYSRTIICTSDSQSLSCCGGFSYPVRRFLLSNHELQRHTRNSTQQTTRTPSISVITSRPRITMMIGEDAPSSAELSSWAKV